ncbi:MAG: Gfo/Idh/MocA family oxidoreductase [Rubellimicrobium sp.]|nr:Gfo/Idh/MocA family oxidoreductase [Rubellimicrobium sp.]
MERAVRWGVIGAAEFARKHMARAIHAAEGAQLAAIATSDPARAAGFLAFAPDLTVYPDYDALLADPTIEAVYIPLPNHLHVHWALRAIAAGKHVLVEKPLGLSAADFDPVIAARDRSGLVVAEAFMPVHHPQHIRARDLVQGGAIGELRHVEAFFAYNNETDTGNIRNRPETGGGALPDIGVYIFGSARFVTGKEPLSVDFARIERENGVDVKSQVIATFPGFSYGGLVSMRLFNRQEIAFHGSTGVLRILCPWNANVHDLAAISLEIGGGRVQTERFPTANHYVHQVENFGRSIRKGAAYPCPLEFSRATQVMIDMTYAAEQAAQRGGPGG